MNRYRNVRAIFGTPPTECGISSGALRVARWPAARKKGRVARGANRRGAGRPDRRRGNTAPSRRLRSRDAAAHHRRVYRGGASSGGRDPSTRRRPRRESPCRSAGGRCAPAPEPGGCPRGTPSRWAEEGCHPWEMASPRARQWPAPLPAPREPARLLLRRTSTERRQHGSGGGNPRMRQGRRRAVRSTSGSREAYNREHLARMIGGTLGCRRG